MKLLKGGKERLKKSFFSCLLCGWGHNDFRFLAFKEAGCFEGFIYLAVPSFYIKK